MRFAPDKTLLSFLCFLHGLDVTPSFSHWLFTIPPLRATNSRALSAYAYMLTLYRAGSIGELLPGNEARIVDPDTGKDMPSNQPGEILVRSQAVMKGKREAKITYCVYFSK